VFGFEKLEVWQKAIELADNVYAVTRRFPDDERFGLTSQLRRAAVSVAANIAEGSGRSSKKDFARFVEIAYGSLMEVVSHLAIATRQRMMGEDEYEGLYKKVEQLVRMLSGLRNSLSR
jgi:four helix bundle protein